MGTEHRRIDSKGRVTIPKSVRKRLNLDEGERVDVDVEDGAIVVRPRISRSDFVDAMAGCVNEDTRDPEAEPTSPANLKADWTSDLPD